MNLPLYEFFIDPKKKNSGVKAVSLVDSPAIESDFVMFNKDSKMDRYVFADQSKGMILGLALVPNKKIYRLDNKGNEFNGYFSADTIEMIRNKFMEEKNTDQVNLQHKDNEYVKGVYLVETYIVKTPEQQLDIKNKGIEAPLGSWLVQYHVDSPELFNEIKTGGYHGFSVEAFLDNQLVINQPTIMNKYIDKFKTLLEEFEHEQYFTDSRIADTGQQITYGKVGEPVKAVVDIKSGNNVSMGSLSDGQYTLEDGTIIAVKGGVLFEVEPKKQQEDDTHVPTPEQIKQQHDAAVKNNMLIMNKEKLAEVTPKDATNAYQPTGSKPKEYKPEAPPKSQEMENDATPAGAANNGSGLKVDPVKSIGAVPGSAKKRKIKTTKMKLKELSDKLQPATPNHTDEAKPSVPDTEKEQTVTPEPATPVKFSKEKWEKMSRFQKLFHRFQLENMSEADPADSTPKVEKKKAAGIEGLALDPNAPQPTDAMPKGKAPVPPVAPEAPVNDATTKDVVKAALPPDIADDDTETPDEKTQENEQELPISDMDKTVNDLIQGKGDGQYNIMVMVEGGVITEAGMEMELSQDLRFSADKKVVTDEKVEKLSKELAEIKIKLAETEKKLAKPMAKPEFGDVAKKTNNFSKEELSKMTVYERLATQKGFRVITAK
jgi:hypothetical protein